MTLAIGIVSAQDHDCSRTDLLEQEEDDLLSLLQVKREVEFANSRSVYPDMHVFTALAKDANLDQVKQAKKAVIAQAKTISKKLVTLAEAKVKEASKHGTCSNLPKSDHGLCRSAKANLQLQKTKGDELQSAAKELVDKLESWTRDRSTRMESKGLDMMRDTVAKIKKRVNKVKDQLIRKTDDLKANIRTEGDKLIAHAVTGVKKDKAKSKAKGAQKSGSKPSGAQKSGRPGKQ